MVHATEAREVLERMQRDPAHSGVLTDFDGTVSSIVDEPAAARPLDGVPALLDQLASKYALVGVLSGRPVAFLQQWLPPSVLLSGLYGLEVVRDGVRIDHPSGGMWREVIDDVATVARATGPAGTLVESKGLSITLHFREHPELESEVRTFAERQAARSGLLLRNARMSFELHPPIDADKGTAVRDLADDLRAVCFLGDDIGDVPAFDELRKLRDNGVDTVAVAVRSEEAPDELIASADVVVDGPAGARDLLAALL